VSVVRIVVETGYRRAEIVPGTHWRTCKVELECARERSRALKGLPHAFARPASGGHQQTGKAYGQEDLGQSAISAVLTLHRSYSDSRR